MRGMNYHVDAGEVVALVGESGAGKSASAMAVVGLLPEYAEVTGSVRLHGDELLGLSDQRMSRVRGKAIGTVFQDPMSALTPVYTVGDQIAEAIQMHNRDTTRNAARARAVELLELVGIAQPERRARAFPHELSGGERQRVVIAIAIANDPDLLICDEPTTALDVTVQAQILEVLKTARDVTGAGVLIITHDLGVVAEFADRALVMYAGRAVEVASVGDALPRPPDALHRRAARLGSPTRRSAGRAAGADPRCAAVAGRVAARLSVRTALPTGHRRMPGRRAGVGRRSASDHHAACIRTEQVAGRSAADIYGVSTAPTASADDDADAPVVLRVRDLVKTYKLTKGVVLRRTIGEVRAVDGVSFELQQGRTLGIVGESGSGKSTTLHQILDLTAPQSGSIEVLGSDVATLDARPDGRCAAICRWCSRIRWHRWTRDYPSSRCSQSHWPPTASTRSGSTTGSPSCWTSSGCAAPTPAATPPNSPAARSSASVSPVRWRCSPRSSRSTNRSRRSTCRSRPASSICCWTCRTGSGWPICSSPTTCRWSSTWRTGWR